MLRVRQQMGFEPRQERGFVNRQRVGVVEVAAGPMLRRATGMENNRAVVNRQTGHFKILERGGRDGGNRVPMSDGARRYAAGKAQLAVWRDVFELQGKQLEGQLVELRTVRAATGDEFLKPRIEFDKAIDGFHAVFSFAPDATAGSPPQPSEMSDGGRWVSSAKFRALGQRASKRLYAQPRRWHNFRTRL